MQVACGLAWCSSAPRFHALNSRGQLRLIAIALRSAAMTNSAGLLSVGFRQLHKEVALHPRNSSTTLMMIRVREMKAQGIWRHPRSPRRSALAGASVYRVAGSRPSGLGDQPFWDRCWRQKKGSPATEGCRRVVGPSLSTHVRGVEGPLVNGSDGRSRSPYSPRGDDAHVPHTHHRGDDAHVPLTRHRGDDASPRSHTHHRGDDAHHVPILTTVATILTPFTIATIVMSGCAQR